MKKKLLIAIFALVLIVGLLVACDDVIDPSGTDSGALPSGFPSGTIPGDIDIDEPSLEHDVLVIEKIDGQYAVTGVKRTDITEITIPDFITKIKDSAFYNCTELSDITIPDSVFDIGGDAFYNTAWYDNQPDGVVYAGRVAYTYKGKMPEDTTITLKDGTIGIADYAFAGDPQLSDIVIPDTVICIGYRALHYSTWYDSFSDGLIYAGKVLYAYKGSIPENYSLVIADGTLGISKSFGTSYYSELSNIIDITIPDSLLYLSGERLCSLPKLQNITVSEGNLLYSSEGGVLYSKNKTALIKVPATLSGSFSVPDSVKIICECAFYECSELTSITIPDNVTGIGNWAFYDCTGLTSITIPDGVISIGEDAFAWCSGLSSVTIGNGVTSIENYAFSYCSGLTSIIVSEDNPNYSSQNGILYNKEKTEFILIPDNIQGSVIISSGITSINSRAFSDCTGLTSITIPDSVTSIGYGAFSNCYSLLEVYNLSSLDITAGSSNNGYVGYYAIAVYTSADIPSRISYTDDGYILYTDDDNIILAGYRGNDTDLILPSNITSISQYVFRNKDVTTVVIPDSVTSIGDNAFYGCDMLTSIIIPKNVTSIGYNAFRACSRLVEVYNLSSLIITPGSLNNGAIGSSAIDIYTSLDAQSKLSDSDGYITYSSENEKILLLYTGNATELALPDGITSIYQEAFRNNEKITSVTIPDSVTSIGDYAFSGCSSLTSVTIGNGVTSIGGFAFQYCGGLTSIIIPDSVTSIGSYAFSNCSGLTGITIPDSVTSIGSSVFSRCVGLTSITIPDSVTSIRDGFFSYCIGLSNITIPDSVTSIGDRAFSGCSNLTSITIPDSVTSIGNYAFENTAWYDNQPDGMIYIGKVAYAYKGDMPENTTITIKEGTLSIAVDAFMNCSGLIGIILPDSMISIPRGSFINCDNLANISLGNGIKNIDDWAFSGLNNLSNINIGNSVTSIGSWAFDGCSGLTDITIPNSVTSIDSWAFDGCSGLTDITIPNSVTSIGPFAFNDCNGLATVIIDSSEIAGLDYYSSSLLDYAETVYVKEELEVGSYITDSFTLADSSDKDGYVKYTKN